MPTTMLIAEVTESAQNITAEHLLFTVTASGECMLCMQISFSSLNAAAASIYARFEHTLGDNTVLAYNRDLPIQTKFVATNTAFGLRLSRPIWLKAGEKINVYAYSSNPVDTSVTYLAKVLDATANLQSVNQSIDCATIPALVGELTVLSDIETYALEAAIATYRNITRTGNVLTLSNAKTWTIGADGVSRTLSS